MNTTADARIGRTALEHAFEKRKLAELYRQAREHAKQLRLVERALSDAAEGISPLELSAESFPDRSQILAVQLAIRDTKARVEQLTKTLIEMGVVCGV